MFKLFKVYLIATVITTFMLLGFVGIVDAIEIEEIGPTDGSNETTQGYNQYLEHTEYVKTDVAYSRIEWYVDDVLKETTSGDGVKTEATFHPWFLIGSDAGTDFVIKAIAYPWEGEGSDTDSFTLTVFVPFQIVTMRSNDGSYEDYNYGDAQGIWHLAYLTTSEPYYTVK